MQASLELDHSWGRNITLGYSSSLESGIWETKATSSTILYESHLSNIASGEELQKVWLTNALTSPGSLKKQQIGKGVSILITKPSQSKLWEGFDKLVLDLQDLLAVGQIWEQNSVLGATYSWSNSIVIFHDPLEAREVLGKVGVSTTSSPSTEVQLLEQLYDFRKPTEVSQFLEGNLFLIPLLREAYIHIRKYFQSSKLFLEIVADPEAIDEKQLVLFIVASHNPDEASESLNKLDKDWWLEAMERSQDKLCITLEFQ